MNTIPQAIWLRLVLSPYMQNGPVSGLIFQENYTVMKQRLRGRAGKVGEVEIVPERFQSLAFTECPSEALRNGRRKDSVFICELNIAEW